MRFLMPALLLLLVACSNPWTAEPVAVAPAPATPALLAEVAWSGGLCPTLDGGGAVCERHLRIQSDGNAVLSGGGEPKRPVQIAPADLAALREQIAATDLVALADVPATETCPRAYDGSAPTYTFLTAAGELVLDSCSVALDLEQPPFKLLNELLAAQ